MFKKSAQQNIFGKIITLFLLVGFILSAFVLNVAGAEEVEAVKGVEINIPEIIIESQIIPDISRIDWDSVPDLESVSNIPDDIKVFVLEYQSDVAKIKGDSTLSPEEKSNQTSQSQQVLKRVIAEYLIEKKELPQNYFELEARGLIEPRERLVNIEEGSIQKLGLSKGKEEEGIYLGNLEVGGVSDAQFGSFSKAAMSTSIASREEAVPSGLTFLTDQQNEDGSWGSVRKSFVTTVAVLDMLKNANEEGTAYQNGIDWIESYIVENNDYLAEQIKTIVKSGRESGDIMSLVAGIDENTGGFVFDRGYGADVVSTAKALEALTATGFTDSGDNPNLTIGMALYYLTKNQRGDGLWGAFPGGAGSISVTEKVLSALLPYKNQVLSGLGTGDIVIKDYINKAIVTLKNLQLVNGSWGDNILNTSLVFYIMKSTGVSPIYQDEAISYIESAQAENGSFSNGDLYTTAKALKALGLVASIGSMGDPEINDIVPLSSLQTGSPASLGISITNNGSSVVDSGILHIVADGYVFGEVDLSVAGVVISPNSTQQVNINLPSTRGLVGDVKFSLFIEGVNGAVYSNSRYDETLTFASDPTGLPGLPVYFIVQKHDINNTPTINVRWAQKNDPNRLNYLFMWREVGVTQWSFYPVDNSWNGAFLLPFVEDQHYETTVGAVAQDGSRYVYYNDFVDVVTSGDSTKYADGTISGSVTSDGEPLPSVNLFGYSVYGASDAEGNYSMSNIRYGASAFHVDNFRYESYWTRFINSGNNVENVKVYTSPKTDTQNPTVTNLYPIGWSNYQIPNKREVRFSYAVNDDIKNSGGTGVVQSAKFEYFDPHDNEWHLVGIQENLAYGIYGTWTYTWNIPADLLGTGYQLRVTVRDFSGKESIPAVYGPFEITMGNGMPTFTFLAPGPGSSSEADLNYTIKWNAHDDEDNASINLFYDVDSEVNNGNSVLITTRYTGDFLSQYEWDTSALQNGTYYLRVIVSDNYNSNVVVTSTPITILHVTPTPPTNLLTKGQVNPVNIPNDNLHFSAIFNDPNTLDESTSYRIQVSTSDIFMVPNFVWDSGKTQFPTPVSRGARTSDISYAGPALTPETNYYWRIKLWDTENNEGAWSALSTFSIIETCGLPEIGDWFISNDCTLNSLIVVPADLVVMPGATLTLAPGGALRLDFKHNKLLVKKGGGIFLKYGASIKQKAS